jgi:hypothetical protein
MLGRCSTGSKICTKKHRRLRLSVVDHICNPSYFAGVEIRRIESEASTGKTLARPHLKPTSQAW